jgi:hypothetical protein
MDRIGRANNLVDNPLNLPIRRGKRPITVRGPLHVQCNDNRDDRPLRRLVDEVIAWPELEAGPLPVGSADQISFKIREEVATAEPSVFIAGREFARVLFGAPTIYITLPLSCAHWAIIRGWAEPHFSSSFGLVPPGVMVVYTPRDEHEFVICRSLFQISYNFSLNERRTNPAERGAHVFAVGRASDIREALAVA